MSVKLIVINGVAEHGKDSFVKYVREFFPGHVINHSTVGTVKKIGKFFGADEAVRKGDAERRLWSDLKDAWTRYCDGPFKEIVQLATDVEKTFGGEKFAIIFAHVREPEEIEKIKNEFGDRCMTVIVTRDGEGHIPDNHADQNVYDYIYDLYVENNGTKDDLADSAMKFVDTLIGAI
jgi:hypothetical protein